MIPSLEGWPTKCNEAPSPHELRLTPLDTNPVFQCRGVVSTNMILLGNMKATEKTYANSSKDLRIYSISFFPSNIVQRYKTR